MRRLLILALTLSAGAAALADGGVLPKDPVRINRVLHEPTQTALIVHQARTEDLVLRIGYKDAESEFAWIVPTPSRPTVSKAPDGVFKRLADLIRQKQQPPPEARGGGGFGGGGGLGGPPLVTVVERKLIGPFETTVLDARDGNALWTWLNTHGYTVAEKTRPVLQYYVNRAWTFTAMRIDPQLHEVDGSGQQQVLSEGDLSLRLTFETPTPIFPLKISSINPGMSDLALYVIAEYPVSYSLFETPFRGELTAGEVNGITNGQPKVERGMWLTQLARKMKTAAMVDDLLFRRSAIPQRPNAAQNQAPQQQPRRALPNWYRR